jgi:uncharacterized protein with FMN-binding domain
MLTAAAVVVGAVLLIAVGFRIAFIRIERNLKNLKDLPIAKIDVSKIADGDYPGSFAEFPVKAEVLVRVRGGRLEKVEIVKHDNGQGKGAEILPSRAVAEQRIDLDAVSGATYSSKVIMKAMENALLSASK